MFYTGITTTYVENLPIGGIRLSTITYSDGDTDDSNDIVRAFDYTKELSGCNRSTAVRLGKLPRYTHTDPFIVERVAEGSEEDPPCSYTDGRYQSPPSGHDYTLTEYYPSPLNRIWKVTPPDWHPTIYTYGANIAEDGVRLDHPAGTFYGANLLYKETVEDPNGNKVNTFTDKKGRTVLTERTDNAGSAKLSTYYKYDDKDRLRMVVPPGVSYTLEDTELLYEYTYDTRDNIKTKKIPGQALISYLYDDRDLMTFMQDGQLSDRNQ